MSKSGDSKELKSSKIRYLCPVLHDGLLQEEGRLTTIESDAIHPNILPNLYQRYSLLKTVLKYVL